MLRLHGKVYLDVSCCGWIVVGVRAGRAGVVQERFAICFFLCAMVMSWFDLTLCASPPHFLCASVPFLSQAS